MGITIVKKKRKQPQNAIKSKKQIEIAVRRDNVYSMYIRGVKTMQMVKLLGVTLPTLLSDLDYVKKNLRIDIEGKDPLTEASKTLALYSELIRVASVGAINTPNLSVKDRNQSIATTANVMKDMIAFSQLLGFYPKDSSAHPGLNVNLINSNISTSKDNTHEDIKQFLELCFEDKKLEAIEHTEA